ncbi:DUF3180 domain-containing protein [Leucobacter sp. M11]|nr:DUF3180 domain-containing protein [Leucobacter sp. M11]
MRGTTKPMTVVNTAITGFGLGLLLQLARSAMGHAPFVPPLSLPVTLVLLGGIVLILAIVQRRTVGRPDRLVNPFRAVRLLAAAKASLLVGTLFAGFGGGMLLQFGMRSVSPAVEVWQLGAATLGGGIVLAVCGAIAEFLCRVPPAGDDPDPEEDPNHADQPA